MRKKGQKKKLPNKQHWSREEEKKPESEKGDDLAISAGRFRKKMFSVPKVKKKVQPKNTVEGKDGGEGKHKKPGSH